MDYLRQRFHRAAQNVAIIFVTFFVFPEFVNPPMSTAKSFSHPLAIGNNFDAQKRIAFASHFAVDSRRETRHGRNWKGHHEICTSDQQ
jgi:putative flippase GtrA